MIGPLNKEKANQSERERERERERGIRIKKRKMAANQFSMAYIKLRTNSQPRFYLFSSKWYGGFNYYSATERGVCHADVLSQCHEIVRNLRIVPATNVISLLKSPDRIYHVVISNAYHILQTVLNVKTTLHGWCSETKLSLQLQNPNPRDTNLNYFMYRDKFHFRSDNNGWIYYQSLHALLGPIMAHTCLY